MASIAAVLFIALSSLSGVTVSSNLIEKNTNAKAISSGRSDTNSTIRVNGLVESDPPPGYWWPIWPPCVLLRVDLVITFPYVTEEGEKETARFQLSPGALASDGACLSYITLSQNWHTQSGSGVHRISIVFNYLILEEYIKELQVTFDPRDSYTFPSGINETLSVLHFTIPINDYTNEKTSKSFICNYGKKFNDQSGERILQLSNLQYQLAPSVFPTFKYGPGCPEDPPRHDPDDVPLFVLQDQNNKICLMVSVNVTIDISYAAGSQLYARDDVSRTASIIVPDTANYSGICEDPKLPGPLLQLTWPWGPADEKKDHKLVILFNSTADETFIGSVITYFDPNDESTFPGIANTTSVIRITIPVNSFHLSDKSKSFICDSKEKFEDDNNTYTLKLKNLRYQTGQISEPYFAPGVLCDEDVKSNIIAIAVGVSVAVVVLIVGGVVYFMFFM